MVEPHRLLPYNHRLRRKRRALLERRTRLYSDWIIWKFDFLRRILFVGLPTVVLFSVSDGVVEGHEQRAIAVGSVMWLGFVLNAAVSHWLSHHAPEDSELEKIDAEILEEVSRLRYAVASS